MPKRKNELKEPKKKQRVCQKDDLDAGLEEAMATCRTQLTEKFHLNAPVDLFRVWAVAKALDGLNPMLAFSSVGVRLVGPFEVLLANGAADEQDPSLSNSYFTFLTEPIDSYALILTPTLNPEPYPSPYPNPKP